MTLAEQVLTIAVIALGTALTRFFALFALSGGEADAGWMRFLGRCLPAAGTVCYMVLVQVVF